MPAKKKKPRPDVSRHIPEPVSREVLTRSGHKCSACGEPCPLERAHIVPFSETHDHSPENLVCLCANCHGRADDPTTGWDVATMERYRDDPWVHRSRRMEPRSDAPSPTVQNLPYDSLGPLLKGREDFLSRVHESVQTRPTVIHGMGGVGKTRAAVEYAWAHVQDYTALLFVPADTPDSLRQNLAALCGPLILNLPAQHATDIREQETAVLQWLRANRWLLICDNVDTPEAKAAVLKIRPLLHSGQILITSRIAIWPQDIGVLELHTLEESDAVQMLVDHSAAGRIPRDDDPARAAEIARQLGGLCLALEQAAAWIRKARQSFADYLAAWEKTGVRLYADYLPSGLDDYHTEEEKADRSLCITYHTSLALLSDHARALFRILSWLAPDPMPVVHLENLEGLPNPRGLLIDLCDLNLATLSADGTTFSVHRLLQEITRQQQDAPVPPALTTALSWLNGEMPTETGDVHAWSVAVPLLPHALALATIAAVRDLPTPTTRLFNCCAILLETRANYPAAEPLFRRALALSEKHLGADHPDIASCLNNLALLLKATNRLAEAEPLMRRALAMGEAFFGEDHPDVAIRLSNLAGLLQDMNRLAEAEPLNRRALANLGRVPRQRPSSGCSRPQ